ncbi:MAG TPA: chemotaxis protein CheW [Ktedonobacteraceae bacterium]|nr:chemotaxis protein CheW [Ktedonobacteraceae bacterium]
MSDYLTAMTATLDATHLQDLASLSDEAFWAYARELAQSIEQAAHPEEYLECRLRNGLCFLALNALYAVVFPPHSIAALPATPFWMPGIVAWRGEVIAVIDLEAYLAGQPMEGVQDGTLLVAHSEGLPVGLLVPGVGNIRQRASKDEREHASSGEANTHEQLDESLIVDIPSMLADALRRMGTTTIYG